MSLERDHIPDEILIDYADDPRSVADRRAIESHLDVCPACWMKLDDFRTITSGMREEETWWAADEITSGKQQQTLRDLAERLAAEDVEAERLLDGVLESQYRFTRANVSRKRRFQTGGVVRLLIKTACDESHEPRFSLALAETAGTIAESLPDDYYPSAAVNELRGSAWMEYATACRYLGRFSEGFDALDRAERHYRRLIDGGMQLARVALGRAALLWEQERYAEALEFARAASRIFAERRATEAYSESKEWEALILHRLGDVAAASETYRQVFDIAESIADPEMKARAARNLAVAHGDRGDTGAASKYLLIALQLYEALGQRAMVVQTRWSIAWVSLLAGNPADAAQRLPGVIDDMTELGMAAEAARARLDLAEALLVLERFDEVHEICSTLVSFFRSARMLTGAVTAAAFLKEAASRRALRREHITHVRKYLDALQRSPDLIFAPPPELLC